MKSISQNLLLIVTGTILSIAASAQSGAAKSDSVAFKDNKITPGKCTFYDGGTKTIRMKKEGAKLADARTKAIARDAGNGLLTVVTGVGFDSSNEVNFKLRGTVTSDDALPDWKIDLYCEGTREKSRERVTDDDGSQSVETEIYDFYDWENDAEGFLTEGVDTVGSFMIITDPRNDSVLKVMTDYFFAPEQVQGATRPRNLTQFMASSTTFNDYGISGIFRGQPFTIISDGNQNKSWVFYNNRYLFMFYAGSSIYFNKKDIVAPYLLIKDIDSGLNRRDFFRLAMMCRYLNLTVGS